MLATDNSGEVPLRSSVYSARILRCACVIAFLFSASGLCDPPPAFAQFDDDDDGDDDDMGEEPGSMPAGTPVPDPPEVPALALPTTTLQPEALVCDGGWRYPLIETRHEIGPARFARQLDLQKDLAFASHAFGYCATAAAHKFGGPNAAAKGPCAGMMALADRVDLAASNLFRLNDTTSCECLTKPVEESGKCEGLREQLTTLRRYGHVLVQRAELVLSTQVCVSPERRSNAEIRKACTHLEGVVKAQADGGLVGRFSLSAPLPAPVSAAIVRVSEASDGRYLSVLPENYIGIRQSLCKLPPVPVKTNQCTSRTLEVPDEAPKDKAKKPVDPFGPGAFAAKMQEVTWGMCNELALADVNAATCRDADVYIDERGQIHLNRSLTTRKQRRDATLCIDISDFDENHPLMVTLGLDPTGSVPKRLWPGETMKIGRILDRKVTAQDILHISVFGKARGISLGEVLRINGVSAAKPEQNREACRMARSWVPVVDHEVPIGKPSKQAVIPIKFDRGRDGETRRINEGDYVLVWVRDIEPSGSVFVEYAAGQIVGYKPPPLLGTTEDTQHPVRPVVDDVLRPGGQLRGGVLGVDEPSLPRRARYPGSRVLRLGAPKGNNSYSLRICKTSSSASNDATNACGKDSPNVLVDEKIFVHGDSHFGVKFHFGYNYFPIQEFEARRTPAAQAAGANVFEVVERSRGLAAYDVAAMLAIYPFGRNPYFFSYNPTRKNYWKHSALLVGFTMRNREPWELFYLGAAVPIANGVTIDLLAAVNKRKVPTDIEAGQLVLTDDLSTITDTRSALAVGVSLGVSFDLDLFERAFTRTWARLTNPKPQFLQATGNEVVPASPGYDPNEYVE